MNKIEVTDRARELMKDFFKGKAKSPVRIYVNLGGCGIRTFGVALENPTKKDEIIEIDEFTYIIERKLLEMVQPVLIDSDGIGFRITGTGIRTQAGCGTCGYMCGVTSGSRCSGDCQNCTMKCVYGRMRMQGVRKVTPAKKSS